MLSMLACLSLSLPALAQEAPAMPMPDLGTGVVVMEGLNGPQGLYVDAEGALWAIDSGAGGEETITFIDPMTFQPTDATFGQTARIVRRLPDGTTEDIAFLPSVAVGQDFLGGARLTVLDGQLYATVGVWQEVLGEEVLIDSYSGVVRINEGEAELVADLWAHELANNPDGTGNRESHPYGLFAGADGLLYVADAAANALLSVDPSSGEVQTIAAFEGLPGIFPSPFRDNQPITDPVPTGVVVTEEGAYVSLLSGAPFVPGSAKVLWVDAEGQVTDFSVGHTMLTDLQMGPDGNLYAVSFGMFTQEGPVPNSGAILRILEDGSAEVVVSGLPFAVGLALDAEGGAYVAINGIAIPNAGMVVYYEGLTAMEGTPMVAAGG